MKILIQRIDRLGDVIFTLPVLEQLKLNYPDAEIHYLTSKIGAEFLASHPLVAKCYTFNENNKSYSSFFNLVNTIKQESYDLYLSMFNTKAMALLGFLSGIKIRIGGNTIPEVRWCFTHCVNQYFQNPSIHQVDYNLSLLASLNLAKKEVVYKLYPKQNVTNNIEEKFRHVFQSSRKTIVIMVSTGGSNFFVSDTILKNMIDELIKQGYTLFLTGQSDSNILNSLSGEFLVNLIDKTSLAELTALISLSDFYIGGDTGPTHIASFLNKPTLFFSARKINMPSRWGPQTDYFNIFRQEFRCNQKCQVLSEECINCLDYVTHEALLNAFKNLVNSVHYDSPCLKVNREKEFFKHSFRILYFVDPDSKHNYNLIQDQYEKEGIKLFLFDTYSQNPIKEIKILIDFVLRNNITIMQGDYVRSWRVKLIRFLFGRTILFIKPLLISRHFNPGDSIENWLDYYKEKFDSTFGKITL